MDKAGILRLFVPSTVEQGKVLVAKKKMTSDQMVGFLKGNLLPKRDVIEASELSDKNQRRPLLDEKGNIVKDEDAYEYLLGDTDKK